MAFRWRAAVVGLVSSLLLLTGASARAETLSIGTLAPKHSLWGKVFRAWSKAVKKRTGGALVLKLYWNGQQGDEATMVAKLRTGQLDGAALSASGLSHIHRPLLALQLPGLFRQWQTVDRASEALYPSFREAFDQKGFFLSSIGAMGRARTFSKGRPIRTPADLKTMKTVRLQSSVVDPALAAIIEVHTVPLTVAEILPALSVGRINVIAVPPLIAEQMQWAPHFDYIGADVVGIGIGALVLSKSRLAAVPEDQLKILAKTGLKAGKMLRQRVRRQDDAAYKRLRGRLTVVQLTRAERRRWEQLATKVRRRLAQGTFSPQLVRRLEQLAGI